MFSSGKWVATRIQGVVTGTRFTGTGLTHTTHFHLEVRQPPPWALPFQPCPPTTHPPRSNRSELPSGSTAIQTPYRGLQSPRGSALPLLLQLMLFPIQASLPPQTTDGITRSPSSFRYQPLPSEALLDPSLQVKQPPSLFTVCQIPCFPSLTLLPAIWKKFVYLCLVAFRLSLCWVEGSICAAEPLSVWGTSVSLASRAVLSPGNALMILGCTNEEITIS